MKKTALFFMVFLMSFSSFAEESGDFFREIWDRPNDPLRLYPEYVQKLSDLPLAASLATIPWSDYYWPSHLGGVAYRWYSRTSRSSKIPFRYATYPQNRVARMSQKELAQLSPAEKYDIFKGDFTYPTVKRERARTNGSLPQWYGLCHGKAAASYLFPQEPRPVVVRSPHGISVPFGASDIKALLAYYIGEINKPRAHFLGRRCSENLGRFGDAFQPECRDTNAGAFHIFLANRLGLQRQTFVADLTRDQEVWNYPLYSYRSSVKRTRHRATRGAAPGTVQEVDMETQVYYPGDANANWNRIGHTKASRIYRYRLELNTQGEIIGGAWSEYNRPDFLWVQQAPVFEGYYGGIGGLYQASLNP